jgi:hypothetical protein
MPRSPDKSLTSTVALTGQPTEVEPILADPSRRGAELGTMTICHAAVRGENPWRG